MKRLALAIAVVLILVSAAAAQANSFITANVPFAFTVGETRMSAGEYRIAYHGNTDVLVITNRSTNDIVAILGYREGVAAPDQAPKLVFHAYGEAYFLAAVAMPGRPMHELPKASGEREFAVQARPDQVTVVARLYK